jgi:rhodanese-related sulfurtransferase
MRSSILVLAASVLSLTACQRKAEKAPVGQAVAVEGGTYRDVSVVELQAMLKTKDFPLINVHVPFEGDLPNTDASIPFDHIAEHLDQLPSDKSAPVVLYCRTGRMSSEASAVLVKLGYTNVYSLKGGFYAWRDAGLPLVGG